LIPLVQVLTWVHLYGSTVGLIVAGSFSIEWNLQMAAALLTAAATVIVYLFLGRLFMRGLLAGALKG
jgi:ABC-type maltose transport system permease subunit